MAGVNRVMIIGNLGRDPELRQTTRGESVTNMAVATSESWTDKQGEKKEKTEWHRVVAWGKLAELCAEHLHKGSKVYVEGKIETTKSGDENNPTYHTQVKAEQVQFL